MFHFQPFDSASEKPMLKSSNTNARLVAFALCLALDPTFGIHFHKTLDTAQSRHLLTPTENFLLTVFPPPPN